MTSPGSVGRGPYPAVMAIVVVVVVVVIGAIVLAKTPGKSTSGASPHGSSATTTPTTTPSSPPTTLVPPASIKVQVLNGVGTGLLATDWSHKLHSDSGYNTLAPDNATSKVSTSTIYVITPGYLPEADFLATTVGLTSAAVDPTVPAPASAPIPATERAEANLVLVIGPNLVAGATSG